MVAVLGVENAGVEEGVKGVVELWVLKLVVQHEKEKAPEGEDSGDA